MQDAPLHGVRVVDFSTLLPGPYASMLLVNMGAEVIKVESPTRPDLLKSLPPIINGQSAADLQLNRGKRSIALDLKSSAGRDIAIKMIEKADVLLEQFRPGVMERLGLGYERLHEQFPAMVYCSITGYGQTGPWAQRAGHDINYASIAGISSYSGRKGSGPPPLGVQWADLAGGSHHAVIGILAAVISARQTGEGAHVDISMTDAMFSMNGLAATAALATGNDPGPETEMLNGGSFYDYYRCADNLYLALGGLEPQFVAALAERLQCPELLGLHDLHDAYTQKVLKQQLLELFKTKPRNHWLSLLGDLDVCVTPVLTVSEAASHEQMVARDMVVDHRGVSQIGNPIKFSGRDSGYPLADIAPQLGEHTHEELLLLGYSDNEIETLSGEGAIFMPSIA